MSHTLEIPDELYRVLERYAAEQRQSPEEALASLLRSIPLQNGTAPATHEQPGTNGSEEKQEYLDPWEGFYGAFESKYPDLIERHDYYIGQAALETHEDDDTSS